MSSSKFIEKDILLMAKAEVDTFGRKAQTLKACEELSELLVELHHELDGRGDEKKIAEELADAFFVLIKQISMLSNEGAEHYVNQFKCITERLEYKIRKARRRRGRKHFDVSCRYDVSVKNHDGKEWIMVRGLGEKFLIRARGYKKYDKTAFNYDEAVEAMKNAGYALPSLKQLYIIASLKDKIQPKLREIGGEELVGMHWSGTRYGFDSAWYVSFGDGHIYNCGKCVNYAVRPIIQLSD